MVPCLTLDNLIIGLGILMYLIKYYSSTSFMLKANSQESSRNIQIRTLKYQKEVSKF